MSQKKDTSECVVSNIYSIFMENVPLQRVSFSCLAFEAVFSLNVHR